MLVHGAIIPPRAVLESVAEVVRSVPEPQASDPAPSKGLRGRFGRHKGDTEEVPAAPLLEHVPVDSMHFPITGFGNLTAQDANRVADAIEEAAAGWAAPEVWFAGGAALDFPGDWSVWARLDGDLDALGTIARGVTACVEGLGLFVDRRAFRPMLSVATVTPRTTGPYLEQVVAALDAHHGEPWVADVALMKDTFVNQRSELVEYRRIAAG